MKKNGPPKRDPEAVCEFCGTPGCNLADLHAGWPKRTGWPYMPDFALYELTMRR